MVARCSLVLLAVLAAGAAIPDPDQDIRTVAAQGRGTDAGRAAWQRLADGKPDLLPKLLAGMNTDDVVAANWLRTAFERILDRALDAKQPIDTDTLLAFAKDPKRAGRARRLALEVVDRLRPGAAAELYRGALDDREFRFEAVALALADAAALVKKGEKEPGKAAYRIALEASRDVQQGRTAAAGLLDLGVQVSVAEHLGFLMDWYVVGSFDAGGQKGFATAYPPEQRIDLGAEYDGKDGKIRWKRYRVREPAPKGPMRHLALVDLRAKEALGDADDAVAFAYTEFALEKPVTAEFRGAADDNFTVWVNGKRAFGFEEYRNGVRLDRHRFQVALPAGRNTVLVKVCQAPANPEPNWEFFLRLSDESGKGIPFRAALKP